jgi:hypothetical protein
MVIATRWSWALLMVAAAGAASAAPAFCTVDQWRGSAEWQRGTRAFQPLRPGLRLQAGDELRTGAQGRVRLRCSDGSAVSVANQSRWRIERFEAEPGQGRWASFWLKAGLIGQTVSPSPGGRWQVRTPTAVTAVRGTAYLVEVGADQSTDVQVTEGEVAVAPLGAPAAAASAPDEAYASKALAAVIPALTLVAAQAPLRCGPTACTAQPDDPERLKAWRQRLGW